MNIISGGKNQKESKIIDTPDTGKNQVLHYRVDYDSTNPAKAFGDFISSVKEMVKRYEQNDDRIHEIETEINDLEHFIEIAPYQNVPKGYKLYRKIAELRRERRACKNENDLLRPVYDHFHATTVLTKLSAVYSEVSRTKNSINSRCYTVRTSALDEYLAKPEKDEEPGEITTEQYFGKDFVTDKVVDIVAEA